MSKRPYTCVLAVMTTTNDGSIKSDGAEIDKPSAKRQKFVHHASTGASFLSDNKLVHSEEKSFKCDMCDSAYRHRSTLRQHKISKHTEKTFKCDICELRILLFTRVDYP